MALVAARQHRGRAEGAGAPPRQADGADLAVVPLAVVRAGQHVRRAGRDGGRRRRARYAVEPAGDGAEPVPRVLEEPRSRQALPGPGVAAVVRPARDARGELDRRWAHVAPRRGRRGGGGGGCGGGGGAQPTVRPALPAPETHGPAPAAKLDRAVLLADREAELGLHAGAEQVGDRREPQVVHDGAVETPMPSASGISKVPGAVARGVDLDRVAADDQRVGAAPGHPAVGRGGVVDAAVEADAQAERRPGDPARP